MALRLKRLLRIGTKGLLALIPLFGAVSLTFKHTVIDPAFYGDCKGIGDFNGDQQGDIAVGGSKLILYFSPDWRRITIALPKQEFTTDMEVADGDGDRDLDLVIPDSFQGELNWFENPRPKGNPEVSPWKHHILGWRGKPIHDVEVGDFNRDRKIDIVTRVKDGETLLWLQREPDNWVKVPIGTAERGEGTAIADINRDGYPDIVQNGYWLENPKSREEAWRKHPVVSRWPALAYVAVGDINKDGRPDILLAPSEGAGKLSWFESPLDPSTRQWKEHVIAEPVSFVHGVRVADGDRNGFLDVIFAEMAQSATKRVGIFWNRKGGQRWELQILARTGSHNLCVGKVGKKKVFGIVGSNWQGPPVEMGSLEPVQGG